MPNHDFTKFPELTNSQFDEFYFASPHKQIREDFRAKVVKVIDGDTIKLKWFERSFSFPVRFKNIAAPELKEKGGKESQAWLERELLGEEVDILIDEDIRVDKWGRLLGNIVHRGLDMGEFSINSSFSIPWEDRHDGEIKKIDEVTGING